MFRITRTLLAVAATVAIATPATASPSTKKDSLERTVTNITVTDPTNDILNGVTHGNGQGQSLAVGTYVSDRILLDFTLVAMEWPESATFGTFSVPMRITYQAGGSGGPTTYPFDMALQAGGNQVQVAAIPASYAGVAGPGTLDTSVVTITIDCPIGTCDNSDGAKYKAKLSIVVPGAAGLDGLSGPEIWVTIHLAHPDPVQCIQSYNFITDQTWQFDITDTLVNVNGKKIVSTNPYGQWSQNILIVNTCDAPTDTFDVQARLDPLFSTNPADNPGNAVFTWQSGETVSNFDTSSFTAKTKNGVSLCIGGVSIPGHSSFLMTVHNGINRGAPVPASPGTFYFQATVSEPDAIACAGAEILSQLAPVTYTTK